MGKGHLDWPERATSLSPAPSRIAVPDPEVAHPFCMAAAPGEQETPGLVEMPQAEGPGSASPSPAGPQCCASLVAPALLGGGKGLPEMGAGAAGLDGARMSPATQRLTAMQEQEEEAFPHPPDIPPTTCAGGDRCWSCGAPNRCGVKFAC